MRPQAMCAACRQVFAAAAEPEEEVTCPACGHQGLPAYVMRLSGPPDLATFVRNWRKSKEPRSPPD